MCYARPHQSDSLVTMFFLGGSLRTNGGDGSPEADDGFLL